MGLRSSICSRSNRRHVIHLVGADGPDRAQVAGAIRGGCEIQFSRYLDDIIGRTTSDTRCIVVLLDNGLPNVGAVETLRRFRSKDAASRIFLATGSRSRTRHVLAALARAGLDDLYLILDPADANKLARDATRCVRLTLPQVAVHTLLPAAPNDAASIVALCLRLGDRPKIAEDVAAWLDWDRKTVWRRLWEANLRPVGELLGLGRLLYVAVLLDEMSGPIDVISHTLNLDDSSLRRLCLRETRLTPGQLRQRGALSSVLEVVNVCRL